MNNEFTPATKSTGSTPVYVIVSETLLGVNDNINVRKNLGILDGSLRYNYSAIQLMELDRV